MAAYEFVLYGICAYIAFVLGSRIVTYLNRTRRARQLGCQPAPYLPYAWWDQLGLFTMTENVKAFKEKLFPDFLLRRARRMADICGRHVETYRINVLGRVVTFTTDPKNVQAVLATQFKDFGLEELRMPNFFDLLGRGIFTSDGQYWEHTRALARPSFVRERVSSVELEERHNGHLHKALRVHNGWTGPTDLSLLFFRLTLDSSTEFLFGRSVESQQRETPGSKLNAEKDGANPFGTEEEFTYAFDHAQHILAMRFRFRSKWLLWWNTPKDFYESCRKCQTFVGHYVDLALANRSKKTSSEKTKAQYVFLDELAERTQDPIELRDQTLHLLLAGRDTTASLLSWLFYTLAREPQYYQKLRLAILDEFGPYKEGNADESITFSKLKGCQTLQHYINEILRLYPVVPANSRRAKRDTTLPRGGGPDGTSPVFVPKGSEVTYSVYVTHRDKAYWGDDADEFRPERWVGRKPGWEYLPFNGGARICLGQQFALTSASYATVRLMQRFDAIENLDKEPRVRKNLTLTMRPEDGVQIRLHEA